MNKIEVCVLNEDSLMYAERMAVVAARLTQRAETITCMDDFLAMHDRDYTLDLVSNLCDMPHPTLQKLGLVTVVVTGASRRFLAQITRHQNEVKFMSGSLQYSDYTDKAQFCVPYEITTYDAKYGTSFARDMYLHTCNEAMVTYRHLAEVAGNDAAGYAAPQGLRNVLIISATPYQLKHMINQRSCRRNTQETRYVMLLIWEALQEWMMFKDCGPDCSLEGCREGKMACGKSTWYATAKDWLDEEFPLLRGDKL